MQVRYEIFESFLFSKYWVFPLDIAVTDVFAPLKRATAGEAGQDLLPGLSAGSGGASLPPEMPCIEKSHFFQFFLVFPLVFSGDMNIINIQE